MLRRGQNYKFCHIESRGKNDVTNLMKLQSASFFLHMEPIYILFYSFQKLFKILQNGTLVTIALIFLTRPVFRETECFLSLLHLCPLPSQLNGYNF